MRGEEEDQESAWETGRDGCVKRLSAVFRRGKGLNKVDKRRLEKYEHRKVHLVSKERVGEDKD